MSTKVIVSVYGSMVMGGKFGEYENLQNWCDGKLISWNYNSRIIKSKRKLIN